MLAFQLLALAQRDRWIPAEVIEYVQAMFDLACQKEPQGIHFWATLYVLIVLLGTLWHILRVRTWPSTDGQLLRLGIRPLGAPEFGTLNQAHVPDALYTYQVNGTPYQGRDISVWKMSASGLLRNTARILPRQVKPDASGKVPVYYNPKRPHKSLLLRPGWLSILFVSVSLTATVGFYLWRW
jgi:hypothetical protein